MPSANQLPTPTKGPFWISSYISFYYLMFIGIGFVILDIILTILGFPVDITKSIIGLLMPVSVYIIIRQRLRGHYTGFWNLRKDIYAEYNSRPEPETKKS